MAADACAAGAPVLGGFARRGPMRSASRGCLRYRRAVTATRLRVRAHRCGYQGSGIAESDRLSLRAHRSPCPGLSGTEFRRAETQLHKPAIVIARNSNACGDTRNWERERPARLPGMCLCLS